MPIYTIVVIASWITFLVVWSIGSITAKRDIRPTGRGALMFWFWRTVLIVIVIIVTTRATGLNLSDRLLFQTSPTAGWIGAILTVLGIAIAVWARLYLGRNWSSHPTRKAEHELVTGGPYAYVRHPIYTGLILGLIGTLFIGYIYTFILFVGITIMFITRIRREERIMLDLFPDQYPAYQARTKRLIPWIW